MIIHIGNTRLSDYLLTEGLPRTDDEPMPISTQQPGADIA